MNNTCTAFNNVANSHEVASENILVTFSHVVLVLLALGVFVFGAVAARNDARKASSCFSAIEKLYAAVQEAEPDKQRSALQTFRRISLRSSQEGSTRENAQDNIATTIRKTDSITERTKVKLQSFVQVSRMLSKNSSPDFYENGYAEVLHPSKILSRFDKRVQFVQGFEPPTHVALLFNQGQVLRAMEDADACVKQVKLSKGQKVQQVLGLVAVGIEPVLAFGTISNIHWTYVPTDALAAMRFYLMFGIDTDWLLAMFGSVSQGVYMTTMILEGLGLTSFLLSYCLSSFIQRWRQIKFELALVPFMKVLTGWLSCAPCVLPQTDTVVEVLRAQESVVCWENLHILMALLSVCAICNTFYRAIVYTRHERNAKNPVIRFSPDFIISLYSIKVSSVLLVSFLGRSENANSIYACITLIMLMHGIAAVLHYQQVPCYGNRLMVNNYRFTGLVLTAHFSLVLLVAELMPEAATAKTIIVAGSAMLPVVAVVSWIISNKRAKTFALREFTHQATNGTSSIKYTAAAAAAAENPSSAKVVPLDDVAVVHLHNSSSNVQLSWVISMLSKFDTYDYGCLVATILFERAIAKALHLMPKQTGQPRKQDVEMYFMSVQRDAEVLVALAKKYQDAIYSPITNMMYRLYYMRGLENAWFLLNVIDHSQSVATDPTIFQCRDSIRQFQAKLILNRQHWPMVYSFVAADSIRLLSAQHKCLSELGLINSETCVSLFESIERFGIPGEHSMIRTLVLVMRNLQGSKWESFKHLLPITDKDTMRIPQSIASYVRMSPIWCTASYCISRQLIVNCVSSANPTKAMAPFRATSSRSRARALKKKKEVLELPTNWNNMIVSLRDFLVQCPAVESQSGNKPNLMHSTISLALIQNRGDNLMRVLRRIFVTGNIESHHAAFRVWQLAQDSFSEKCDHVFQQEAKGLEHSLLEARKQVAIVKALLEKECDSGIPDDELDYVLVHSIMSLKRCIGLLFVVAGDLKKDIVKLRAKRILEPIEGMPLRGGSTLCTKSLIDMVLAEKKSWFQKLKWEYNLKLSGLD